jgi:hypothetical protein
MTCGGVSLVKNDENRLRDMLPANAKFTFFDQSAPDISN